MRLIGLAVVLGLSLLALLAAEASAQQAASLPRIGFLLTASLSDPRVPPLLQAFLAENGAAPQLRLLGAPGRTYIIEACADFVTWTAISTNFSDLNGTFVFTENMPANAPQRFYRAKLSP